MLVVVLNVGSLTNGFTLDDRTLVLEDPRVRDLGRVPELLLGGYRHATENSLYRPLTSLSLALNYAATGPSGWGYHLVNLVLHLTACLLAFRLGSVVLGHDPRAFVAALLFAAHPVHVEAVANVVGRAEVLAFIFLVGSFLTLRRYEAGGTRRLGSLLLGGMLYLLALLSKENAIVGVGIWVLMLLFTPASNSPSRRVLALARNRVLWVLFFVSAAYLALRYAVLGTVAPGVQPEITFVENPLAFVDTGTRVLTAVTVLVRYLGLLAWPFTLSADYSYNAVPLVGSALDPRFVVCAAVLAGLAAAAVAVRGRRPDYLFALLFFLVSISVVSNVPVPIGATMAERFLYLPSIAFCWAAARLGGDLGGYPDSLNRHALLRSPGVVGLCLLLIVPWSVRTVLRNRDWRDDGSISEAAVVAVPGSAKARVLLADYHFGRGDYRGAEEGYRQALGLYPEYAGAAINLAASLDAQARFGEALSLLASFAERSGKFEPARLREVGRAHMGLGAWDQAAAAYEGALALFEPDPLAHRNLGGIYIQFLGKRAEGQVHIRRSLELAPDQDGAATMREALR